MLWTHCARCFIGTEDSTGKQDSARFTAAIQDAYSTNTTMPSLSPSNFLARSPVHTTSKTQQLAMDTSTHIASPLAPLQIFVGNHATPMHRRDPHPPFERHDQRHNGEGLLTRLPGVSSFALACEWLV